MISKVNRMPGVSHIYLGARLMSKRAVWRARVDGSDLGLESRVHRDGRDRHRELWSITCDDHRQ